MKLLFLNPRLPYPLISGDRVKSYHLLKHLAKHHSVTLVSYYQGSNIPIEYIKQIEDIGVRTITFPLSPIRSGLNAASHLFTLPLEIGYYTGRKFRKKVNELLANENFDLAISFFLRSSEYLINKNIPKILIAEDCRILYQNRSYRNSKNLIQKAVRLWEYLHLLRYEPKTVKHFDICTCVTDTDINKMKETNPNKRFMLLTNGVDLDVYKPVTDFSHRSGLLFTGKLDVYSNTMMAEDIITKIFPKIHENRPNTTLTIAGAKATSSLRRMASESSLSRNISINSNVPDISSYYQNARVFLHPHNGASGIQNKVLEAMACGCCVVTTPTGIQGIAAKHLDNVIISQSMDEMVKYSLLLLNDDALALKLSENARRTIEQNHSWNAIYQQLDDLINAAVFKKK